MPIVTRILAAPKRTLKRMNGFKNLLQNPLKNALKLPVIEDIRQETWMAMHDVIVAKGVKKKFALSKLYTSQNFVGEVVLHPDPKHTSDSNIEVAIINKIPVVCEGNHRAAIAWLAGESEIEALSYDFGTFKTPDTHEDVLRLNKRLSSAG